MDDAFEAFPTRSNRVQPFAMAESTEVSFPGEEDEQLVVFDHIPEIRP